MAVSFPGIKVDLDSDPGRALRRAAAEVAVREVQDGMVLGYGTGRAAGSALEALARRMREDGLRISGVPSSSGTEHKARALGLPLISLDDHPELDLTIDGADEVDPKRRLTKGGGGALMREKVLAATSKRLLIVIEAGKLVPHLGATRGLPLEVLPFAWNACATHLRRLDGTPTLRRLGDRPAITDNGNWVIDCDFPPDVLADPETLDGRLHRIPGLLETGLFVNLDPVIFAGMHDGATGDVRVRTLS